MMTARRIARVAWHASWVLFFASIIVLLAAFEATAKPWAIFAGVALIVVFGASAHWMGVLMLALIREGNRE